MDLFSIPIIFNHFCNGGTCYTETQFITISDLDLLVIGINCLYGYFIMKYYLKSKKSNYIPQTKSEK